MNKTRSKAASFCLYSSENLVRVAASLIGFFLLLGDGAGAFLGSFGAALTHCLIASLASLYRLELLGQSPGLPLCVVSVGPFSPISFHNCSSYRFRS